MKGCIAFILLSIASAWTPVDTFGQAEPGPYERLTFRMQYFSNVNRNAFHRYWSAPGGIGLTAATPFYYGDLECGANVWWFDEKQIDGSDFVNTCLFVGWGINTELHDRLSWYNGVNIGGNQMVFEDEEDDSFKYESEMGYMCISRFDVRFSPQYHAHIAFSYQQILTHHRIHLFYISAGAGFSFDTPGWLIEVLR